MAPGQDGALRRTVLPGGLRVVSEQVPGARSVAYGVWVGVGSRDESPSQAGSAHFLEHLLFKGTRRRSALEIASVMDAVGGESNAFTDKELTCYYARVLGTDLPVAVDVVTDMVTSSLVRAVDLEAERGVLLEEIAMRDDDPDDTVHDLFAEALWGDTPVGRPVIGTTETISALTRAQVAGFYRRRYTPPATVVAAAGGVDHDAFVELVQRAYGELPAAEPLPPRGSPRTPRSYAGVLVEDRPGEQAHVVLGTTALRRDDPRRWALAVLSGALGGGTSSRLFQKVREERGLAYSVYSFTSTASDTGSFGVSAACAPGKVDEVLRLCRAELDDVRARGLTDAEVTRAVGQLRAGLVLGWEDTGSRMHRIGKAELVSGQVMTVDEVLEGVSAVTPDDVRAVAADVLGRPLALAAVGPLDGHDLEAVLR